MTYSTSVVSLSVAVDVLSVILSTFIGVATANTFTTVNQMKLASVAEYFSIECQTVRACVCVYAHTTS